MIKANYDREKILGEIYIIIKKEQGIPIENYCSCKIHET